MQEREGTQTHPAVQGSTSVLASPSPWKPHCSSLSTEVTPTSSSVPRGKAENFQRNFGEKANSYFLASARALGSFGMWAPPPTCTSLHFKHPLNE